MVHIVVVVAVARHLAPMLGGTGAAIRGTSAQALQVRVRVRRVGAAVVGGESAPASVPLLVRSLFSPWVKKKDQSFWLPVDTLVICACRRW